MGHVSSQSTTPPRSHRADAGDSRIKDSGEQYDDRIVEVKWDGERETWVMMRIRTDKPHGNYKGTVEKIIISIRDGVELDAVRISRPCSLCWKPLAD